jgi:hypothetical protein
MDRTTTTEENHVPRETLHELRGLLSSAWELISTELQQENGAADDDDRLATEYERTAALYRRRAARRPEDAADLAKRAEWFERRALVKRSGEAMPRELRTPAETLAVVDEFRQTLAVALAIAGELDAADLAAFGRCLSDPGPREIGESDFGGFLGLAMRVVAAIGGVRRADNTFEVTAYNVPLTEGSVLPPRDER